MVLFFSTGGRPRGVQASPNQGDGRGQAPSLRSRACHANDPEARHGTDPQGDTHGHSAAALMEVGIGSILRDPRVAIGFVG